MKSQNRKKKIASDCFEAIVATYATCRVDNNSPLNKLITDYKLSLPQYLDKSTYYAQAFFHSTLARYNAGYDENLTKQLFGLILLKLLNKHYFFFVRKLKKPRICV